VVRLVSPHFFPTPILSVIACPMYPYAASGLEGEGGFGLNEERPVGPVGKLLDFKSKTAGNRIKNLFNQPTSTKLSPTRRSIDETALLKNFNYTPQTADVYDHITQSCPDFFDALKECVRAKAYPPGSVLPKIDAVGHQKPSFPESQTSYIQSMAASSSKRRRKKMKKRRRQNKYSSSGNAKIYKDPHKAAAVLQRQMERRQRKEEEVFMKELVVLQNRILEEEERRQKHKKDTRVAYTNARKSQKRERRLLKLLHRQRRATDATDMANKVKQERSDLETKRSEASADREHMKKTLAAQKKKEWAMRKKEREAREERETALRNQLELEKRKDWEMHRKAEERKRMKAERERERHEEILREKRRNEKYAQNMMTNAKLDPL
jgi:hypothetical protein